MKVYRIVWLAACAGALQAAGSLADFAGTWIYRASESEVSSLPAPPAAKLTISVSGAKATCSACGAGGWVFTVGGRSSKTGDATAGNSIESKWEGPAVMINVLVRGAAPYTVMDRWELNRDGSRLTIERVIQRGSNEAESKLVYSREGEGAVALATRTGEQAPHATSFLIAKGTRIPLRMLGTVSSRTAQEGDRVYLETSFPVTDKGRVVIPPGSQVAASVTHVQQPGRVKGRSELMLRFESLVLPNGVTRDFRARAATVEPGAGELDSEGKVKGPASKGEDARKIGETTAAGAGVGGLAGAAGGGAGSGTAIGAAAGAAAGLGRVLVGRGEQTTLRKGDAVEMVLDRNLVFTGEELAGGR